MKICRLLKFARIAKQRSLVYITFWRKPYSLGKLVTLSPEKEDDGDVVLPNGWVLPVG